METLNYGKAILREMMSRVIPRNLFGVRILCFDAFCMACKCTFRSGTIRLFLLCNCSNKRRLFSFQFGNQINKSKSRKWDIIEGRMKGVDINGREAKSRNVLLIKFPGKPKDFYR